jgi:hypothetical protein
MLKYVPHVIIVSQIEHVEAFLILLFVSFSARVTLLL